MSLEAIKWALTDAPDVPPHLVATLLGLANHADPIGRGAAPSHRRLAHYTRKDVRNVRKDLTKLEESGLIRRGDQKRVAYLPPDRRPVVWDLAMERARQVPADLDDHAEARSGTTAQYPQAVDNRGDADVRPVAHVPSLTKPAGRSRPLGQNTATSGNTNREDAHARRTILEEEVKTSNDLGPARELLLSLGEPWNVGTRTAAQLAPAVADALAQGWPADKLRAHLAANPDGVRAPGAVLRARLGDLPAPPVARKVQIVRAARPAPPPWCGACDHDGNRLVRSTVHEGRWVKCPRCHPDR